METKEEPTDENSKQTSVEKETAVVAKQRVFVTQNYFLTGRGINTPNMTKFQATQAISKIKQNERVNG